MDQKKNLTTLDPQLKATYDRIMAVPTSSSSTQPVQYIPPVSVQPISVPPPVQTSTPVSISSSDPVIQAPVQPIPQPVAPQPIPVPTQPIRTNTKGKFATGAPVANHQRKSGHTFLISSIIAGMVLFGIYILFWLKFFNIPVGY